MTVCNMSIEAGARAGMIAPDEKTFAYIRGREFAPQGRDYDAAVERWRQLPSDAGAKYDRVLVFQAKDITPQVTWGTNPGQVVPVTGKVPRPADFASVDEQKTASRSLEYMDVAAGMPIESLRLARVFLGAFTNARLDHPRAAEFEKDAADYRIAIRMAFAAKTERQPKWTDASSRRLASAARPGSAKSPKRARSRSSRPSTGSSKGSAVFSCQAR